MIHDSSDQDETVVSTGDMTIRLSGSAKAVISDGVQNFAGFPPKLVSSSGHTRVIRAGNPGQEEE